MSTASPFPLGAPCWADLGSTDPDAARAFYSAVLGWVFDEPAAEFGGYSNARVGGAAVAGLAGLQPGGPTQSVWTVYLHAPDAAAQAAAIAAAGGAVIMPAMQVGPFGHMAIVADPGGAVFGLWQPLSHGGFGLQGAPGGQCWAEVATRGGVGVADFYAEVFGMTHSPMPGMEYWMLTPRVEGCEAAFGVLQMTEVWGELPPHWMIYFATDDVDAAAERVKAAGGAVHHGPFDSPYGRIAVVADCTGGVFSLIQLAAPPAEPSPAK